MNVLTISGASKPGARRLPGMSPNTCWRDYKPDRGIANRIETIGTDPDESVPPLSRLDLRRDF